MTRLKESELVLPVLYILKKEEIAMKQLIKEVVKIVQPGEEDMQISRSRPAETKFHQKVRNLFSHKKINPYVTKAPQRRGVYSLSPEGEVYVELCQYMYKNVNQLKKAYIKA